MHKLNTLFLVNILLIAILLNGCSAEKSGSASVAVENYLQALVDRDLNRMIAASCADWEPQAKVEFDSFAAVKLKSENLKCQTTTREGKSTRVVCSGSIIANYGAEDLVIEVADRAFTVIDEGGEARMCGYSKN